VGRPCSGGDGTARRRSSNTSPVPELPEVETIRAQLAPELRGAAVTAVQIDGVLHEFSSIAGVREDVTDIVLNIKEIAIRMEGDGPKRMVVRKQGPGVVTAGDIQTVGDAVRYLEEKGA